MNRLRNRLILVFAVATIAPLLFTIWISLSLLNRSLSLASTRELDQVSQSLEKTGRELYQRARESLKDDANTGRANEWQRGVLARRPVKVAVLAQAAKTARIAWAVLTSGEAYRPPAAQAKAA